MSDEGPGRRMQKGHLLFTVGHQVITIVDHRVLLGSLVLSGVNHVLLGSVVLGVGHVVLQERTKAVQRGDDDGHEADEVAAEGGQAQLCVPRSACPLQCLDGRHQVCDVQLHK